MVFNEDFLRKIFEIVNANFDISLKPKTSDDIIEEKLSDWFDENPVRSLSSVNEFLTIVDKLFQVNVSENGRDHILKIAMQNDQEFRQGLRKNRVFFNSLVKKLLEEKENHIERDMISNQEEILNISEISTLSQILDSLKQVSEISNKFLLDRSKKRYTARYVQLLFDFFDSIVLISIRWMEIYKNKNTSKLKLSLEMLEWDINTLYDTIFAIRNMAKRFEKESAEEQEKSQKLAQIIVSKMR
ncbi:MAG: hypothetical protein ACTSYH_14880 [Candidatus Heimdallarchaeaceae archaeon]